MILPTTEAYLELSQTSMMELFQKKLLDVWQGSKYASELNNYVNNKILF